ncbi:MAG: hypothetical protein Q9M40_12795 [Sulfurimonas sp.]|nr:hypothetical protein [Sulfurimonas sp.]
MASCNILKNDYQFKYCVVYKNFKKPTDRYKRGVAGNIIEFGLRNCLHLVNAIKTDPVLDFTKLLSKNITPKMLNCEEN